MFKIKEFYKKFDYSIVAPLTTALLLLIVVIINNLLICSAIIPNLLVCISIIISVLNLCQQCKHNKKQIEFNNKTYILSIKSKIADDMQSMLFTSSIEKDKKDCGIYGINILLKNKLNNSGSTNITVSPSDIYSILSQLYDIALNINLLSEYITANDPNKTHNLFIKEKTNTIIECVNLLERIATSGQLSLPVYDISDKAYTNASTQDDSESQEPQQSEYQKIILGHINDIRNVLNINEGQ